MQTSSQTIRTPQTLTLTPSTRTLASLLSLALLLLRRVLPSPPAVRALSLSATGPAGTSTPPHRGRVGHGQVARYLQRGAHDQGPPQLVPQHPLGPAAAVRHQGPLRPLPQPLQEHNPARVRHARRHPCSRSQCSAPSAPSSTAMA
ncbi:putative protein COFACTOR ASSEMBLY OF COMPLEX C SUBUNIT B CCB3, chloroplastic [Iris pallida]|uniref:Uncharacterized protein n=1 Tax=Iris pallida TaxID=29817 RepID=A0AAX6F7R8_IRIPA|nr:putative protein COFACTOR ASSEMBLY OF COMPLEX C SUBUNIT B CCB3, chloroplastic [Iris pallida]